MTVVLTLLVTVMGLACMADQALTVRTLSAALVHLMRTVGCRRKASAVVAVTAGTFVQLLPEFVLYSQVPVVAVIARPRKGTVPGW